MKPTDDPMKDWPNWKRELAGVAPRSIDDIHYCNFKETEVRTYMDQADEALTMLPKKPRDSKYQRTIHGKTVDIYDILLAYDVTSPPLQHLIKKALMAGQRGHKDRMTDLKEILSAAQRAVEMEED